jgi:hypothetical protein
MVEGFRSLYSREGSTDAFGWRHSTPGLAFWLLAMLSGAALIFASDVWRWSCLFGFLLGGVVGTVDTVVTTLWRPKAARAPSSQADGESEAEVCIPADRMHFAFMSTLGAVMCAVVYTVASVDRSANRAILRAALVLFAAVVVYFLMSLILGGRIALVVDDTGIRNRSRLGRDEFIPWGAVSGVRARQLMPGMCDVVIDVHRGVPSAGQLDGGDAHSEVISSGLLRGGAERVLRVISGHRHYRLTHR